MPPLRKKNKFSWGPGDVVVTQCMMCKHAADGPMGERICGAFPGGNIPTEIIRNRFDHRKPHPLEANPVHFEPRDDVPADSLAPFLRQLDAL